MATFRSFLDEVVESVLQHSHELAETVFVLPSKRAGTFLRNSLATKTRRTQFSPQIFSIEGFVEQIAKLTYANSTQQLFELYTTYQASAVAEKDSFLVFSKWAQTLLQDINEIDRYLIDASALFTNLSAIQELTSWSVDANKTKMMQDYLAFWNTLEALYKNFNANLVQKGIGHQGLVYREAVKNLEVYLNANTTKKHIFIGFNALNTSESQIIQTVLKNANAAIYWDIDTQFIEDPIHDAGLFIREHRKTWPYLKTHALNGLSSHFASKKNIQITGVPKNVAQAKYVGTLLKQLNKDPEQIKNTALVLADESLLNPILNAIPAEIEAVNVTMGYPLLKTPVAHLFSQFFELYLQKESQGWFYKSILSFLAHPYLHEFLKEDQVNKAALLSDVIKRRNLSYISSAQIKAIAGDDLRLGLLFFDEVPSPEQMVDNCLRIIMQLKEKYEAAQNSLALEYLYRFSKLFNQLLALLKEHTFITDLKSLKSLYLELLAAETVDFQGDPLEGLQIMGMLESRNLDFETVIITSVNEGILPSGKSNNSFIPFDLKRSFGLPTYKEKDAVYTYHFYRLLQRAKNIYIIYNTEPDTLEGGERSRLIAQLLTDSEKVKDIKANFALPEIIPMRKEIERLKKEPQLLALIKKHAQSGFSPTSLSNYIRNPIDFYKRNLLGIDDSLAVEETIAANTFGTVVHDSLEELYTPLVGQALSIEKLRGITPKIKAVVQSHFAKSYKEGTISHGKNLIALHVVERYLANFIKLEIAELQNHAITIVALEQKLSIELELPELDFKVVLKGKLDRVDRKDGVTRIIDYKTGKVEQRDVSIVDWQETTNDYVYSKAFQLLCYAIMYSANQVEAEIEAGIVSFKNLKSGVLRFTLQDKRTRGADKNTTIDQAVLTDFSHVLKKLILEICDPSIDLVEKEIG